LHPQIANLNYFSTFDLEPNIYSFQLLESWIQLMQKESIIQTPIHIKFNTGLNRLGFRADAVAQVAALVQSQQGLKIASVFSHIAASEDPNEKDFTLNQIQKFEGIAKQFITILGYTPLRHMLNTSGIINYASIAQYDMVRSGIGLYGFGNQKEVTANLKQVVTLRSIISQIHEVETGQSVGYNRASFAKQPSRIATIPIGHADGISRRFGNGTGYAYIKEEQVPYVGNVCMDMLMLDVTNVDCKEGDTVMIFKDQEHVEDMANRIETIPYELLTAISQRIKRKFK
jgi:alanine racemase